jgi:hypothetical protein
MKTTVLLSVLILVAGACATTPLAPTRVASVEAGIRSAEEAGAASEPRAALHLRLAREELAMARHLAEEGDTTRAEVFLERAAIDAMLSRAITRTTAARAEATTALAALNDLEGATK